MVAYKTTHQYAGPRAQARGFMLSALGRWMEQRLEGRMPWTNVLGVVRSLLATSTLLTLLFNHSDVLFTPVAGGTRFPNCAGVIRSAALFCLTPDAEVGRWVAIAVLLVAASGFRPRVMAVPQWWATASLQATASLLDGGDQAASVLTFLLIPAALTDPRAWHWGPAPEPSGSEVSRFFALASLAVARIQVAAIYLHASLGKLKVEEWRDGTAVYYWFNDVFVGGPPWLMEVLSPILRSPAVLLFTWGTMALEFVLFMSLVAFSAHTRSVLLILGCLFHFGIIVVHGLPSFALTMFAALLVLLRPPERLFVIPFVRWPSLRAWGKV